MKKGFTLIELLVSLVVGGIFIYYLFAYQFTIIQEMRYAKDQLRLAKYSYQLGFMITRGFKHEDNNFSGLISATNYDYSQSEYNTTTNDVISLSIFSNHTLIQLTDNNSRFTYNKINTEHDGGNQPYNDLLKPATREHTNNAERNMFILSFIPSKTHIYETTQYNDSPTYDEYQKFVYTK
jgi:prepilin-type N-terminal cleavage/methylation domain-containing protein